MKTSRSFSPLPIRVCLLLFGMFLLLGSSAIAQSTGWILITPGSATVPLGGTLTLTATIQSGPDQPITWSMGASYYGSLSSTTTKTITYTAPSTMPQNNQFRITATMTNDSTNHSSIPITLVYPQWAQVNTTPVRTIPSNFLGYSHEWSDSDALLGPDPNPNKIYRNLIKNLNNNDPNAPFLIRVGGGSTDTSGEPMSSKIQHFMDLYNDVGNVQFSLGVNLGGLCSPSPVATDQGLFFLQNMPKGSVAALEIGNEVDQYPYVAMKNADGTVMKNPDGTTHYMRPCGTDQTNIKYLFIHANSVPNDPDYLSEFSSWRQAINSVLSANSLSTKYMGPAFGGIRTLENYEFWSAAAVDATTGGYLQAFETQEGSAGANSLGIVSQHFYSGYPSITTTDGSACVDYSTTSFPQNYLLTDQALTYVDPRPVDGDSTKSTFWVPSVLKAAATTVHANSGQTFRVAEMNSMASGGLHGISDAFSSSIWAIDTMFEFLNAGVDGVNFHQTTGGMRATRPCYGSFTMTITRPGSTNPNYTYALDSVNPLYYGMYFFHQATPAGAKLLSTTVNGNGTTASSTTANNKVWSTVDASGNVYVAVLNKSTNFTGNISIMLQGYGNATAYPLTDPNGFGGTITNTSGDLGVTGITFAGQTFDGSTDGTIQGTLTPQTITPLNGVYTVSVDQKTMAVLLKIAHP